MNREARICSGLIFERRAILRHPEKWLTPPSCRCPLFCVVDHFVAEDAKRRTGTAVARSKGHMTCHSRDFSQTSAGRTRRRCLTRLNLSLLGFNWHSGIQRHHPQSKVSVTNRRGDCRPSRGCGLSCEPEFLFDHLQPHAGTPCPKSEVREK